MLLELESVAGGVQFRVRALAGARKSEIRGEQEGALKVAVTQVAEKGKANKAIVALLAKSLGLSKSQVTLVRGQTSGHKTFVVAGIDPSDLRNRFKALTSVRE